MNFTRNNTNRDLEPDLDTDSIGFPSRGAEEKIRRKKTCKHAGEENIKTKQFSKTCQLSFSFVFDILN